MNIGARIGHVRHQQSTFARHWLNSVCACTIANLRSHTKLSMHLKSAETQGTGCFDFSMIKSRMSMCARQMLSSQHCFTCLLYHAVMKCFLIGSQPVIKWRIVHQRSIEKKKRQRLFVSRESTKGSDGAAGRKIFKLMSYQILEGGKEGKVHFLSFCTIYTSLWYLSEHLVLETNCAHSHASKLCEHIYPHSDIPLPSSSSLSSSFSFPAITIVSTTHML